MHVGSEGSSPVVKCSSSHHIFEAAYVLACNEYAAHDPISDWPAVKMRDCRNIQTEITTQQACLAMYVNMMKHMQQLTSVHQPATTCQAKCITFEML